MVTDDPVSSTQGVAPLEEIVMLPAPLLILIPVPAAKVAAAGVALVDPIITWPLVIVLDKTGTPAFVVTSTALSAVARPVTAFADELKSNWFIVLVAGHVVVDHAGAPVAPDWSI
jgi:hypothetical protein